MKKLDFLHNKTPLILAPMEDVTDISFRKICKNMGADILYTEFISSDALSRHVEKSKNKMDFDESERPLAIQIFGADIDAMTEAARIAESYNPDFIDINWGCPVKKIVQKGAGSGILKDIPKMIRITKAVVNAVKIPVTVKTRLGWDDSDKPIIDVAQKIQDVGVSALCIHGRTRSQLYSGKADWTLITDVKQNSNIFIPIIGNGDITDEFVAQQRLNESGVDALMIGRAAIGNPWIFKKIKYYFETGNILPEPSLTEKVQICLHHLKLSIESKGEKRAVLEMRKHYSSYFKAIPNFKQTKIDLMNSNSSIHIEEILFKFMNQTSNSETTITEI